MKTAKMDFLPYKTKERRWKKHGPQTNAIVALSMIALLIVVAVFTTTSSSHHHTPRRLLNARKVLVLSTAEDHPIARKQKQDLQQALASDTVLIETMFLTLIEQRHYVETNQCGETALSRFDELVSQEQEHLASELWKYCVMAFTVTDADAIAHVDSSSPLLVRLHDVFWHNNLAVLGDGYFPDTIHGSLLLLDKDHQHIAQQMLQVLLDTSIDVLQTLPLLLPRTFYALIQDKNNHSLSPGKNGDWYLLQEKCHLDPLRRPSNELYGWTDAHSYRINHHCPEYAGFCCSIHDDTLVVLMSRHPLVPYQRLASDLAKPYNAEVGHYEEDELPFISTIQEHVHHRTEHSSATLNFFDTLLANDCLPSSENCSKCLREKGGANCQTCGDVCACYCKTLCREEVEPKFVAKELVITPPVYARDPNRLIPRIVHQTWFEDLSPEKYPNMSRLVESFRMSGWEYKFYTDDEAANFLSTHFPSEIREAYDTLRPGAFKADLFRYCVLLIHGGVYADVDIMLESALDFSIGPGIGFMVPIDEPGKPVNRRMCLWNGFIAAAPGHPFLAKAVETVVNQVRNRFTSVDVDATFCPDPELSVLHAFDTLFTAGPCLLGSSINRVLGLHGQHSFVAGEIDPFKDGVSKEVDKSTSFVMGADQVSSRIPGRTIILHQDKWDMGAHRFTFLEQNLVVSATDLQDSNDREKIADGSQNEHYSKTHAKTGIYGLEGLYASDQKANEDIRIYVDVSKQSRAKAIA